MVNNDLIDRLGCAYLTGDVPCEACTFCAARAEIERLREDRDRWKSNALKYYDCERLSDKGYEEVCEFFEKAVRGEQGNK